MSFYQLWLALRARLGIIVLILCVTVLAALGYSLLQSKEYAASTAVVVDVKSLDPVSGGVLPGAFQPGYMSTQIDIIYSGRVAQRVVRALHLPDDPGWQAAWREADGGKGDFVAWAASALVSRLDARPSRDSNVIHIGFSGTDPTFVAAAANAFAQAFVETDLELKIEPARQYTVWFEEQTKRARDQLATAQRKLSSYQQNTGIVAADEKFDAENTRLNDLTSQLTQLQGQIVEMQSKRTSGNTGATMEAMQSPLVNGLKADIARLDAKLQESSGNLGPNHPQTLRARAELASLRAKLNSEVGQIASSFQTVYQINKAREAQLDAAIAVQKQKVLGLNKERDELNILRGDVDLAQKAFETVSQRASQTRLESQSSQTNVSVLSRAEVPLRPSKPRILRNLIAAAGMGAMLGICVALLLELGNRRVRSAEDLLIALDVPVLASIGSIGRIGGPRPPSRRLLGRVAPLAP